MTGTSPHIRVWRLADH